jgi:hypothetical protein
MHTPNGSVFGYLKLRRDTVVLPNLAASRFGRISGIALPGSAPSLSNPLRYEVAVGGEQPERCHDR